MVGQAEKLVAHVPKTRKHVTAIGTADVASKTVAFVARFNKLVANTTKGT